MMESGMVPSGDIAFDLKTPCKDCPFRTTTKLDDSYARALTEIIVPGMEMGTFGHSCHVTDPRSDFAPAKEFKGKMQHCAGALIMMEKDENRSNLMTKAILDGRYSPAEMDMQAPVYSGQQMIGAYLKYLTKKLKETL